MMYLTCLLLGMLWGVFASIYSLHPVILIIGAVGIGLTVSGFWGASKTKV